MTGLRIRVTLNVKVTWDTGHFTRDGDLGYRSLYT